MSQVRNRPFRVAQKTLQRMVPRAKQVARLHESHPAMKAVAVRAIPAADAFQEAYRACRFSILKRAGCIEQLREQGTLLEGLLRTWIPVFAAEHGVDLAPLRPETDVVDDVVAAAKHLVSWIEDQRGAEPPAHVAPAIDAIDRQVALVEGLMTSARDAAAEAQSLAQTSREKALEFHKALVVLRRVLASLVGTTSRDYQMLRYRRARQLEDASDVVDEGSSNEDAPAAPAPSTALAPRSGQVLGSGEMAAE